MQADKVCPYFRMIRIHLDDGDQRKAPRRDDPLPCHGRLTRTM
jgi:hypothetical protein